MSERIGSRSLRVCCFPHGVEDFGPLQVPLGLQWAVVDLLIDHPERVVVSRARDLHPGQGFDGHDPGMKSRVPRPTRDAERQGEVASELD